jgi:hypothetical protein
VRTEQNQPQRLSLIDFAPDTARLKPRPDEDEVFTQTLKTRGYMGWEIGRGFRERLGGVKTLLLGPILALLPRRWRESNPFFSSIHWPMAAALSGIGESCLALVSFVYWYSYSVTHWAQDAVSSAIAGGAVIPPDAQGFAALALMFLHPLTWMIGWFGVEGAIRFLGAAFADNVMGIYLFFVVERVWRRFTAT